MILGSDIYKLLNKLNFGGDGPGGPPGASSTGNEPDNVAEGASSTVSGAATGHGPTGYAPVPTPDFAGDFSGLEGQQPVSSALAESALSELSDRGKLKADPELTNSLMSTVVHDNDFGHNFSLTHSMNTLPTTTASILGKDVPLSPLSSSLNMVSPIPMGVQMAETFGSAMAALTGQLVGDPESPDSPGPDKGGAQRGALPAAPKTEIASVKTPGILSNPVQGAGPAEIKTDINGILRGKYGLS